MHFIISQKSFLWIPAGRLVGNSLGQSLLFLVLKRGIVRLLYNSWENVALTLPNCGSVCFFSIAFKGKWSRIDFLIPLCLGQRAFIYEVFNDELDLGGGWFLISGLSMLACFLKVSCLMWWLRWDCVFLLYELMRLLIVLCKFGWVGFVVCFLESWPSFLSVLVLIWCLFLCLTNVSNLLWLCEWSWCLHKLFRSLMSLFMSGVKFGL